MKIRSFRIPAFVVLSALWVFTSLAQKTVKVACMGNSVTYGLGLKDPKQESYPAQLQRLLSSEYKVGNFGHSGATLLKKGHNPYFKTKEFKEALDFKPDIAVVHLGLNDTDPRNWPDHRDDFQSDYAWLLDTLRKVNPAIKLYVCRLTPIFNEHPRFKSGTRDWYWQIQQQISEVAKANNASLVDLNTPLHKRPDLFPDNLHPVKEGTTIIATTIYQKLTGDFGGLKLPQIFSDNMVLQRQQPIPIYGKANAGERVDVAFNSKKLSSVANARGEWKVMFPAMSHGGPYTLEVQQRNQKIILSNILVGDVWLCSGQSNMAFMLKQSEHGAAEAESAGDYPLVRLLKMRSLVQTDATVWDSLSLDKVNKLDFFSGDWKQSDRSSAQDFSAIGYYFGKMIHREEGVPVGLIDLAVGGSTSESWIDRYTMEHDEQLVDMLSNWRTSDFVQPWCRERADLNLKNATVKKQRHPYEPCYNYEAGIYKLTQSPIKGVIWYQGESNTHNPEAYKHTFAAMINSWRQKWGYQFPFYYVQLSAIDRPSWPVFRETQQKLVQEIANSGMAVSLDLGDSLNVHPIKKAEIGNRLALLALRNTYKRKVTASGPEAIKAVRSGNQIEVSFTSAKQLSTPGKKTLRGFSLVNDRGEKIPVSGTIKKERVVFTIPQGQKIAKILYAWEPFTRANLVNEAGLPASTFRLSVE